MRKLFLFGISAPILYIIHDIVGGLVTSNYSFISNTISALTQVGSNYAIGRYLLVLSAICSILFGVGVYQLSHKTAGFMLSIIGIFNVFTATIFPQDILGLDLSFQGTIHLVLVGVSAILIFPAMVIIGNKHTGLKKFTNTTMVIMLTFMGASMYSIGQDIPVLGVFERISIYSLQIWFIVVSCFLYRKKS